MNSTTRDAQAPSHRACLLPSVARTPSVTQITPAKKITFLKRGDPQFSGVRLAVHQRNFKSFGALMDELSQRVPLSFGVRSVTTPRGLHGLSALEQLEDGGCYLCSDKKPPKTPNGPGRPQGRRPSSQQSQDYQGQCEAPGTSSSCRGLKAPRRIMLVKNGDPRVQQTVVLSHRNTRNLTAFLSKATDLLRFPVKQVYTTSGKKVDSLKGLLCGSSVLVCAGHESFRPLAMEDARRNGTETLSGQTLRNKNGSWGPKAKQSVIHSRSRSGGRRFSLLSEKSGLGDTPVSLPRTWMGPAPDRHPQDTPAQLGPLVAGDDVEKKVHVNEDGSLSVEMKVCFHLLGEDVLQWSRRVGRASPLMAARGEGPVLGEADSLHRVWEGHPGGSSEPGARGLGPCEAGCQETSDRGRWQPGSRYEIWTNPLYTSQGEGVASRRRTGLTQHYHSRSPWSQGGAGRKRSSRDSISLASSDRPPEDSEPNSCCSSSLEGSEGGCGLHPASGAASQRGAGREAGSTPQAGEGLGEGAGPGPEEAGPGRREHHGCLKPRTRGTAGALSDSSPRAGSHEESSEKGEQHQGHPSKMKAMTSRRKATHGGGSCSPTMSPLSLRNEDPQAEESGQSTGHPRARGGPGMGLPPVLGLSGSGEAAGGCSPPSSRASALGGRRKQESRASAVSSPSISGLSRGAQRGRPRQHGNCRDTHCPLDSPESRQVPGPPSKGRTCPASPTPSLSENASSTRNQASRGPGPPLSASLHSQDTKGINSAPITPMRNSDCTSNFYPPYSPSAETEGDPEFRAHSPAPIPSNTSDSFSSQAGEVGEKAGGDGPKPSLPLVLPVQRPEGGKPGAHGGGCCSQIGISPVPRTPGGKTPALQASRARGHQGPLSEACLVCSRYCPTPPRAQPSVKKHPTHSSSHSDGDHSADWGPGGGERGEEKLDSCRPRPPSSQSGTARRGSPSLGPRPGRMFQGKVAGGGECLEEQEEGGGMMPVALPQVSPEAVVREWLSNIPEEPVPMKYDMVGESTEVAADGLEGPTEDAVDKYSPERLEGPTQTGQPLLEEAASEKAEPDGALPVTRDAGPESGEGLPGSRDSEAPKEPGAGKGAAVDRGVGQCMLPRRVSASIQIMKALMGSKQGRPSSLPEVSSGMGRRLSHSAQTLIACLASLHFFDEDVGSPAGKVRFIDSPRYQELLSTFRALCPGCGLRPGELDLGLQELGWCQALPGLMSHVVTEDFTPTSSSGVDVGSGSGGSGEGSGPGAVDCALVPERTELPLKIPSEDFRTSENPEDLENQQLSGSEASSNSQGWACATRKDGGERNNGEQTLGSNLDRVVESTMQEEGVQSEKIKEEDRAELQEAVEGFPEEGRVMGQELSGAGSWDGEGTGEDKSVQEEEAGRDPASAVLHSPEGREEPTGPPRRFSERDPNASGNQSGPIAEHALEKLPREAEAGHEQTQAKFTQGAGEKGTSTARRASLDPDALWVSTLLRKMEMVFLGHLASATAELRARWSLQSNDLLDQMVAELQQDMGQRLQNSTEKELRKIQSRAGGKAPRPHREAIRRETSLQTEQRRHRLQGLRNLSAFTKQTRRWGPPSLSLEDVPTLSGALGTWLGREAAGEEFCPCEACMKKKVIPTSSKDTTGVASAPIKEGFDLQQILQKKKGGCADGETAEAAPEKRGLEPLQRDPSGTGTVQRAEGGLELGLGQGPEAEEEEEEGEGSQTLGRNEDPPGGEEGAAAQKGEGKTDSCVGSDPKGAGWEEQGSLTGEVGEKEENTEEGSGAEDCLEGEASGGGDRSPGGQHDVAETAEAQEAEGEGQPETGGGNQGEKDGSPQIGPEQGQLGEASGNSSPGQEGRPTPPPVPGADMPRQRSGPKTGLSSSSTASPGNCSQLSQKGSEEEPSNGVMRSIEDKSKRDPCPERKVTGVYPESSTSEQEGATSGSRTPERGTDGGLTPKPGPGEGSDLKAEKVVKSLAFTEMRFKNLTADRTEGFGQDDLDF
ncbi:PREDICTED: retinitis pigmentosa 1-like 1 protein [Ceratotherium simum simum]|uniref:Retinitis pigmentosa 1-like 1 protein n=1 Tax=Ceratotherium simum simum TaxID=73337 RepID=A0ABM0HTC7_CERSS|nr:PREDICTED: retinitis pigmentosa 1-like 1 protein [Ceratotherium simum simum]